MGGVQRDREREREKEKERERRERRHSSHGHSSSAAVHAAKKQRIAETKQQDEDPFAVTPENVHKTQMIDADTDMILRYFGCLLMRKAAGLLRLYVFTHLMLEVLRSSCSVGVAAQACTNSLHSPVLLPSLLRSPPAPQAGHCCTRWASSFFPC